LAFGATEDVSLETALTAAGLLQQDAARLVLKSSPKDRFTLFSQLLGLATLEKFESWMEQRSKSAAAQLQQTVRRESELRLRLDDLVLRLSRLRDVARARPAVSEVHERLVSALAGHYTGQIGELDRERAAAIASAAAFLAQESGEVGRLGASLPAAPLEGESWDTERSSLLQHLDSLKASLVSVREATTTSEQDLRAVRDSQQQLERLAAAALHSFVMTDVRCATKILNQLAYGSD